MDEEVLDTEEALSPQETLDSNQETEIDVQAELEKQKELANNYKIRAERAEKEAKKLKSQPKVEEVAPKTTSEPMSLKDIRALQDVNDEDVDEVIDYAKFKGISIAEAKKHPVVQTLLKTKEEERKTALATNTGGSKRGAKSSDDLIRKVERADESLSQDDMKQAAKQMVESLLTR